MTKFYICNHCGNLVGMIKNAGVPIICCGEKMHALEANTIDASLEKHVPVVSVNNDTLTVTVGNINHPMTKEHLIEWVYVQTQNGGMRKCLYEGNEPQVAFSLGEDKPIAVFAYCNLHGLWKTQL